MANSSLRALQARFPIDVGFLSKNDKSYIAISLSNDELYVGDGLYGGRYSYSQVLGIDVVSNEGSISETNRGSQAVGAAIGGLAFGGLGFLAGGLSGSSRTKKRLTSLHLKLRVDDPVRPSHLICFMSSQVGLALDHPTAKAAWGELDAIHGHLLAGLRRSERTPEKPSIDELYRALELHRAGLLSDDALNELKARAGSAGQVPATSYSVPPVTVDAVLYGPCKKWMTAEREILAVRGKKLSWTEMKVLHENMSIVLKENIPQAEGQALQRRFLELGARVELHPRETTDAISNEGPDGVFDVVLHGPHPRLIQAASDAGRVRGKSLSMTELSQFKSGEPFALKLRLTKLEAEMTARKFHGLSHRAEVRAAED